MEETVGQEQNLHGYQPFVVAEVEGRLMKPLVQVLIRRVQEQTVAVMAVMGLLEVTLQLIMAAVAVVVDTVVQHTTLAVRVALA